MGLYGTGTIRLNRTNKCLIDLVAVKKKRSYESYVSDSAVLVYALNENST